jgi:hypothetical protein
VIHPDTELRYINDTVGYGVVATKLIPKGTITWAIDQLDRSFTIDQLNGFDQVYKDILETYSYRNSQGDYVLCWDHGRFVNHSFNSNCLTTAYEFELAIRDILPGEQLTDDYGYLNISEPFKAASEGTRRKVVYPDDLEKYYKVWDKKLLKVFPVVPKLEQPLRKLISDSKWEEIKSISSGVKAMESIYSCYFKQ